MIRLDIQPYCEDCIDFDPDVTRNDSVCFCDNVGAIRPDTVIRCSRRIRCAGIKRYLEKKARETETP